MKNKVVKSIIVFVLVIVSVSCISFALSSKENIAPAVEIDSAYSEISQTQTENIAKDYIKNSEYNDMQFAEIHSCYLSDKTWRILFAEEAEALDGEITVIIDDNTQQVLRVQNGYSAPEDMCFRLKR